MKKIICLCLVFTLCFAFASCSKVIENANFDTDGYILINDEEVIPEYVMKIGDNSISFAEFRYYYLNQKAELDGGDDDVWVDYPEYVDILKKYVEEILVEIYSIRALAAESGVEPNFEKVSNEIKEYKDQLSGADYKEGLAAYNLTEELYEYVLQGYELYTSLFDHYFGDKGSHAMTDIEMSEYIKKNYIHAKHILINPNTTMSDEEYEKYLADVLAEAKSAESFDTVISKYSDDANMPQYGYYFTSEEMPEEFVAACNLMEEGEISELVKSSYGYHIIQKLPYDNNDLKELKDVVYNQIFTEIINERIATIEVEYAPEYEHVSPFTVK